MDRAFYEVTCFECPNQRNNSYKCTQKSYKCRKCKSVFVENRPLKRERYCSQRSSVNGTRPALWINSMGEIQTGREGTTSSSSVQIKVVVPTERVSDGNDGSCNICLEDIVAGSVVSDLANCNHKYHLSCISQWVKLKNSCPSCTKTAFA